MASVLMMVAFRPVAACGALDEMDPLPFDQAAGLIFATFAALIGAFSGHTAFMAPEAAGERCERDSRQQRQR